MVRLVIILVFVISTQNITKAQKCNLYTEKELGKIGKQYGLDEDTKDLKEVLSLHVLFDSNDKEYVTFPKKIALFEKLQYLHIVGNSFSKINIKLSKLKCLQYVFLNHNNLKEIPSDFKNINNLKVLELEGNKIADIHLDNLSSISLRSLNISTQEVDTTKIKATKNIFNLVELNMSGNNMYIIPEGFFENLPKLNILDISNTKLVQLPVDFIQLKNIAQLNLSGVPLSELPKDFDKLITLQTINLSKTKLKKFPDVLFNMKNLTLIDLRDTDIAQTFEEKLEIAKRYDKTNPNLVIYW